MSWAEVKKINSDMSKSLDNLIDEVRQDIEDMDTNVGDIKSKVNNSTYGLSAIKSALAPLTNSTYGLSAIETLLSTVDDTTDDIDGMLSHSTYGLQAIVNLLNSRVAVKSVQRGTAKLTHPTSSDISVGIASVTVSAVNTSKSIVIVSSVPYRKYTSSVYSGQEWVELYRHATGFLKSSTEVHIVSNDFSGSFTSPNANYDSLVAWQLIEFY